jgi:zinc transporter, ZIP family
MKAGSWKRRKIILLWLFIAVICAISTVAGYSLFSGVSTQWMSFIQAFAGGAILVVLANSMMPESYEHGGETGRNIHSNRILLFSVDDNSGKLMIC